MAPAIATIACAAGIFWLFWLDRDRKAHASKALWIPVIWLLVAGSRPVSGWIEAGPTPWAILEGKMTDKSTEASPLNVVVFSTLITAGLVVLVRRKAQVKRLLKANWPTILFFAYCALSSLWSEYPGTAFRRWIRSSGDLLMVLIVLTEVTPVAAVQRLLSRVGFLLFPISILLIKYYPELGQVYSYSGDVMYNGVTMHKNTLGMTCLIFGLGSVWRFCENYRTKGDPSRDRRLLAHGAILATVVWLLWKAQSATALTCFLMGSGLIAMTSLFAAGRKVGFVHFLVAALVSLSLFALFLDPTGHLVESVGRNPTLTGRTAIWTQVLKLAGNPLVGTGFESFWVGDRLQRMWINIAGDRLNEAHNGYLEVYLNLGWCGVTLLAVLIVTGYQNVIVAFRRDRQFGGLKLAYLVVTILYSLTEAGFRMISVTWIFFLLATVAVPKPLVLSAQTLGKQITERRRWLREARAV